MDSSAKIDIIVRQTNYTPEEALQKLTEFEGNEIHVIKDFLGIPITKVSPAVKSVNQAIYKELRGHLDSSMKKYRERVEKGESTSII